MLDLILQITHITHSNPIIQVAPEADFPYTSDTFSYLHRYYGRVLQKHVRRRDTILTTKLRNQIVQRKRESR